MFFLKILTALTVMGIVLWFATGSDVSWLTESTLARAGRLGWIIIAGASSSFAALWLLGFRVKDFTKQQAM